MRKELIISLIAAFLLSGNAYAQEGRGLITSTTCPYTCADAGIPEDSCREYREGNTCMVEDLTQPAGHRTLFREKTNGIRVNKPTAIPRVLVKPNPDDPLHPLPNDNGSERRGLITSGPCPITCQSLGVAPEHCREWSEGTRCFVEDFTQAPGHRTLMKRETL